MYAVMLLDLTFIQHWTLQTIEEKTTGHLWIVQREIMQHALECCNPSQSARRHESRLLSAQPLPHGHAACAMRPCLQAAIRLPHW